MTEKDDDTGIDWAEATDEQLAQAAAELKNRQPLTDFNDLKWATMSDNEFEQNKESVFSAMRQFAREKRILKEHSEYESEKAARASGNDA